MQNCAIAFQLARLHFPSKCFFLSLFIFSGDGQVFKISSYTIEQERHVNRVMLEDPHDTKFLSVDSDLHSLEFSVSVWTRKKGMKPALVLFLR